MKLGAASLASVSGLGTGLGCADPEVLKIDTDLHIFESPEAGRDAKSLEIWEYGPKSDLMESGSLGTMDEAIRDITPWRL